MDICLLNVGLVDEIYINKFIEFYTLIDERIQLISLIAQCYTIKN